MAFPVIAASNSSVQATNATSHTMDLPAGISSGELLVACVISDARPGNQLGGDLAADWSFLAGDSPSSDQIRIYLYFRRADGGEGSTVAFTTTTAQCTAHRSYRITGAHESTNPFIGTGSTDSGTSINPAALNPSTWDVEDTLWIVFTGNDDGTTTVTGFPTNYINTGQISADGATDGVTISWCTRENSVASEDPSAVSFSASEPAVSGVVAIRPSAVVPPITPNAITAPATFFEPLIQNTTIQLPAIQIPGISGENLPLISSLMFPDSLSASAAMQEPVVVGLGDQQNVDPMAIDANSDLMTPVGVFLVGPIQPTTHPASSTMLSPFIGSHISPETITQLTSVESPIINLSLQFLLLDTIVSGQFVFSPFVQRAGGSAGVSQSVFDTSKASSMIDPDFAASVSDTARVASVQDSATALLDQES